MAPAMLDLVAAESGGGGYYGLWWMWFGLGVLVLLFLVMTLPKYWQRHRHMKPE